MVGPGAIGSVCAAAVQQAGRYKTVLCGRRDPGRITVANERTGEKTVLPGPVLTSPADVHGPVDWVLLAVKAHQTAATAGYLSALCDEDTTVVVLQNGVEHRERVMPLVGQAAVLPAIVWFGAESVASNHVVLRAGSRIMVPSGEAGDRFASLMHGGMTLVETVDDFTTELWRKLTSNAVGGLMALTGRPAGIYRREDIQELARAMAAECLAVARAEGARLDDTVGGELVDALAAMAPGLGSSILADRVACRPLEWEARNGVVRRLGRRHGIATPVSDVVVPLLAATSESG
ncbi:2-dehydropantoate 2-reductase [Alloactinosynnema sp. L-07]|nr:oxidoreductase [Alloactinosynnema sp. L-07]CRK55068.1 2-dehydropantoate 2-reductase [Alloactinosynnema sp. L-07]